MPFQEIIRKNKSNLAFVVGNGINRYNSNNAINSWDQLLLTIWNRYSQLPEEREVPKGIFLTEFYDVLEMLLSKGSSGDNLQKEFCNLMSSWKPLKHHKVFVGWAIKNNIPILTTNFENTLGQSHDLKQQRNSKRRPTDFYPWESCFAQKKILDPANEFAIWHVNGMQRYHRSIRLGLTHYMGSVERARNWFHKGDEKCLFSRKNEKNWIGCDTWLHVLFNKPIAVFGLELGQTEVFLRWLLIERAKYFSLFPERNKEGWYFYTGNNQSPGKLLFLKSMGVKAVKVESYDELYSLPWETS